LLPIVFLLLTPPLSSSSPLPPQTFGLEHRSAAPPLRIMATFGDAPKGNGKAGEKIFKTKCAQCHGIAKSEGHKQGTSSSSFFRILFLIDSLYACTVRSIQRRCVHKLIAINPSAADQHMSSVALMTCIAYHN